MVKDNDYLIESIKCKRHIFKALPQYARDPNTSLEFDEVVQAINSASAISVYGQEIPIRDRFIIDGQEIDWKLYISALTDKYQGASNFFLVEAKTPESIIKVTLDIPKEGVFATQQFSAHEKRDTLLSYVHNQENRFFEKSNLELEKKKFYTDYEREEKYIQGKRRAELASATAGTVSGSVGLIGAVSAFIGVFLAPATGGASLALTALGAVGYAASSSASLYASEEQKKAMYARFREEDEERKDRLRLTTEGFKLKASQMWKQHEDAERQEMANIRNMANANIYGNTTNAINFQGFNEHVGASDIHLIHYRPAGDVLKKLRWYYQEYGFELMVPDHWVFGISNIRGHIQLGTIMENLSSPNSSIRKLIEARLLAGVRVVDLDGKPLEAEEYPDSVLLEGCLANYDRIKVEMEELERQRAQIQAERDQLNSDIAAHTQTIAEKDQALAAKDADIAAKANQLRDITNQLNAAKRGVETYRNWEKGIKEALGIPTTTNAQNTTNKVKETKAALDKANTDLQACQTAKGEVEAAKARVEADKARVEAEKTKAIEDARVKETEFNNAMREELNKRSGVEATLNRERAEHTKALEAKDREKTDAIAAKDKEKEDALAALRTQHTQEIEDLKRQHEEDGAKRLTCQQFRALAGHHFYDLGDQNLIANIEKLGMVLAIVVKYMLLFNVDQRFGSDHDFQAVFKDLYEIGENDLVGGFMDCFAAED